MKQELVRGGDINDFFLQEEGCWIGELYNKAEDRSFSLARTRVSVGNTTNWHSLRDTAEMYFILQGRGLMELGTGLKEKVLPGDSICIPANVAQRIANIGDEELIFLCICVPAFSPDCYEAIDQK